MDLPTEPNHSANTGWTPPPVSPRQPGIWSGLAMVVLYLVLQVVVSLVLGVVLVFGYGLFLSLQGHKVTGETVLRLVRVPDVKTGLLVAVIAVVAAFMLWLIHRLWRAQWSASEPPGFGFVVPRHWRYFVFAILIAGAAAFGGGFLTRLLAQGHAVHQNVTVMGLDVTLGMRIVLAILVVCVAPVVEEVIFRGVLLSGLMRHMPAGRAVAISAVIFGCVHLPDFGYVWYPIPALVILGLLLAWMRLYSHSLWPSITMHATNNLVAVIGWFVIAHPHS